MSYWIDDELGGDHSGLVSVEHWWDYQDRIAQLVLPGDGSALHIGELTMNMPHIYRGFLLDVLNARDDSPTPGAELRFGFGDGVPPTTWRAESGGITGGRFLFVVIPEPGTALLLLLGVGTLLARRR